MRIPMPAALRRGPAQSTAFVSRQDTQGHWSRTCRSYAQPEWPELVRDLAVDKLETLEKQQSALKYQGGEGKQ